MKKQFPEKYRTVMPGFLPTPEGSLYGVFVIRTTTVSVIIIADDGAETGWEHVSVSCKCKKEGTDEIHDVTPTWVIMSMVKDLFWEAEECVLQFHPPKSQYVNHKENVLHMWRQVGINQPTPPIHLV